MPTLALNRPDAFTKELRLQANAASGERWLRISSNLLPVMGFEHGARFERRVLGPGAGFEFRVNGAGPTSVYRRTYNHRRNRPLETVIDFKSQSFVDAALPAFAERVHLTFRPGVIVGRPVAERHFHIRKALSSPQTPLEAFVALSSGIDASMLGQAGFGMQGLLEYRPREKRDTTDLSETGIVTALANNQFRFVFNEDIYRINFEQMRQTLAGQPPVALLAVSPQCDDWSPSKAPSIRARHLQEVDGTTVDMVYEVLRLIETVGPACVHIENVPGFGTSSAGELLALKLRRWGFFVTSGVYDARSFGGATSRKRYYLVASVFPGFREPVPTGAEAKPGRIWDMIADQLPACNDATNTSSLRDSLGTPRSRLITPESTHAPTIMKSQARHAKDSVFIRTPEGRYLFPNETILRRLQGIPDDFVLDGVGQEIATEQIGQSVCGHMHHAFAVAIRQHLEENRRGATLTAAAIRSTNVETPAAPKTEGGQGLLGL